MASGNGTKIHRRLPSGEDLQTTLLVIILGSSWRNLAIGDVGLTSKPRLRVSSFFGQEPPPQILLPPLSRRHSEVLRQTLPSDPTLYDYPRFQETKVPAGQHCQKGPEAQKCSSDEWALPSPSPRITRDLPL